MLQDTPIPRWAEEAAEEIKKIVAKIDTLNNIIEEGSEAKVLLEDERRRLEDFLKVLTREEESISKEPLADAVLEVMSKHKEEELSPSQVADIIKRDKRSVSNVMKAFEKKGRLIKTREENIMGRYPRPHYKLTEPVPQPKEA